MFIKREIQVIGKSHIVGRNAQKEWDYYKIHFAYADDRVEGLAVASASVTFSEGRDIVVGKNYNVYTAFCDGRCYVGF